MKPEDCSRYERCNANICPFDDQKRRRRHLGGEPVCFWLREWSKTDGRAAVARRLPPEQSEAVSVAHLEIMDGPHPPEMGWGKLRNELIRASSGISKLLSGERLREKSNA